MNTTTTEQSRAKQWQQLHQAWLVKGLVIGRVRTAKEAVAAGIQLHALKAALPHGQFADRVNQVGIRKTSAHRYMASARCFHAAPEAFFKAVGSASKLFELLPLDEAQALAQGKSVGTLTLEVIAGMTAKELRQAIQQYKSETGFVPSKPVEQRATVRLNVLEERMLRRYRKCKPEAQEALLHMAGLLEPST